jgi:hypothetical protein
MIEHEVPATFHLPLGITRLPKRGLLSGGLNRRGLSKFWQDLDMENANPVLVLGERKENTNEGGVTVVITFTPVSSRTLILDVSCTGCEDTDE